MNKPTRNYKDWYNAKYDNCACGSYRALVDGLCSDCHEENYLVEVEEYYLALLKKDNWIDIDESLPEIPEGKYGIKVLIATWDEVGGYQDVVSGHYAIVTNRDGKYIDPFLEHLPVGSADFVQLYIGGDEKFGWMPVVDDITHWKYYPEPPKLEKK